MITNRLLGSFRVAMMILFASLAWQDMGAIGEEPRRVDETARRHAEELSRAFSNAAKIAMPSVVTVSSRMKAHPGSKSDSNPFKGRENPFKGTPFEDFFGRRGLQDLIPPSTPRREGTGSGVIIDKSGIVLTSNHVVDGADQVTIRLADGREFKGEDVKTDEPTDLAIIRIRGAGTLPVATLGDSDKLSIGDWVIAVGNPFGLEQTASAGIISGLSRELADSGHGSVTDRENAPTLRSTRRYVFPFSSRSSFRSPLIVSKFPLT